jgi:site-specific recombinase XerC
MKPINSRVVQALVINEVTHLLDTLGNNLNGIKNKAIILILVDCGLRLGELLNISNINMKQQIIRVDGKTGERVVRYGQTTAKHSKSPSSSTKADFATLWLNNVGDSLMLP